MPFAKGKTGLPVFAPSCYFRLYIFIFRCVFKFNLLAAGHVPIEMRKILVSNYVMRLLSYISELYVPVSGTITLSHLAAKK